MVQYYGTMFFFKFGMVQKYDIFSYLIIPIHLVTRVTRCTGVTRWDGQSNEIVYERCSMGSYASQAFTSQTATALVNEPQVCGPMGLAEVNEVT